MHNCTSIKIPTNSSRDQSRTAPLLGHRRRPPRRPPFPPARRRQPDLQGAQAHPRDPGQRQDNVSPLQVYSAIHSKSNSCGKSRSLESFSFHKNDVDDLLNGIRHAILNGINQV